MKSIFTLLLVVMICSISMAAVPKVINYQGYLTDGAGDPVADNAYLIKFIIYDASTAGTEQWNSGFQTINTVNGKFEIFMGASPQPVLPDNVFEDTSRYLGITVGTDPEITPRSRLITVPYAYHSLRADTATYAIASQTSQISKTADYADEADLAYDSDALGGQEPSYYVNVPLTQTITGTKTFNDLNINTTTRRISFSQAAFIANDPSTANRSLQYLGTYQIGSDNYFHANVSLPDGAVVTQLEGSFLDDDATYGAQLILVRIDPSDASTYNMAQINTTGQPYFVNVVDNSIGNATIDNELYNYVLFLTIKNSLSPQDVLIIGAEIEYTITKPLP